MLLIVLISLCLLNCDENFQLIKIVNFRNMAKKETGKSSGASKPIMISKTIMLEESKDGNYMSIITKAQGPNSQMSKGPRDDLLL